MSMSEDFPVTEQHRRAVVKFCRERFRQQDPDRFFRYPAKNGRMVIPKVCSYVEDNKLYFHADWRKLPKDNQGYIISMYRITLEDIEKYL